jgi:hypothetical protein
MLHPLYRGESYTGHGVRNGCREAINANLQRDAPSTRALDALRL